LHAWRLWSAEVKVKDPPCLLTFFVLYDEINETQEDKYHHHQDDTINTMIKSTKASQVNNTLFFSRADEAEAVKFSLSKKSTLYTHTNTLTAGNN